MDHNISGYGNRGDYKVTSKKEFLNLPENKALKQQFKTTGIACYICGGLSLLVGLFTLDFFTILTAIIIAVCGYFVQTQQSKPAAIVILVTSVIGCLASLIMFGTPTGIVIIVAGILALRAVITLDKKWTAYQYM